MKIPLPFLFGKKMTSFVCVFHLGKIYKIGGNKAIVWLGIPPTFGDKKGQIKSQKTARKK